MFRHHSRHRYPDAHACKGTTNSTSDILLPDPKVSQVEAAKALLAKNFPETSKTLGSTSTTPAAPTSASITKSKQPKDPAKLAKFKAVELIKMRHKASPGDPKDKNISVALDRRVHLYVSNEAGGERGQPVLLWFRKVNFYIVNAHRVDVQLTHAHIIINRILYVAGYWTCSMSVSGSQKRCVTLI